jgi:hypothetical protein
MAERFGIVALTIGVVVSKLPNLQHLPTRR